LGHLSYAPFSSKNSIRLFFTQIQSLYTFLLLLSVNQGVNSDWSTHSTARVANAAALGGRDRLTAILHNLGFEIR
jgi:hypothetical protein